MKHSYSETCKPVSSALSLRQKLHRGFTLLEMIVVLGIIALMSAVLLPVASGYLTQSRVNTQNSNARVIFNSLQTIMQEYEFSERAVKESLFYGTKKTGQLYLYCVNGVIETVIAEEQNVSGTTRTQVAQKTVSGGAATPIGFNSAVGTNMDTADPQTLGSRLSRLYTGYNESTWCALVTDYSVRGIVSSSDRNSRYLGGYPMKGENRSSFNSKTGAWNGGGVITDITDFNLSMMRDYCNVAYSTSIVYN